MPELGSSPAQIVYGLKLKIVLSTTAPLLNANNTKDIHRKLKKGHANKNIITTHIA
jgi:hypothetical protein